MTMNTNSSKSTISKKHLIAIAVVLAIGVGAGTFIDTIQHVGEA